MKPISYREGSHKRFGKILLPPPFPTHRLEANYNHTYTTFTQQASVFEYLKAAQKSTKVIQMPEAITEIKQL